MHKRNRVVVTGMGVLAPNGTGLEAFWNSLVEGRSGIGPITLFDATEHRTRIAGEVKGFDPFDFMPSTWKPKRMGRHTQLAYAATQMALRNANFDPAARVHNGILPVCIGVSTSALDVIEKGFHELYDRGPHRVNSGVVRNCQPQAAAHLIAEKLGVETHASTFSSACPSGIDAIASAAAQIKFSGIDIAIAGGADAPITPLTMASFASSGLSSFANEDPARSSRPYDADSDSGVISEGAGILVIENLDHALARGAKPHLEITGFASQMDHDTEDPFAGLESSMRLALSNANRKPCEMDYICAYGPGHPVLDVAEVKMIRRVFGAVADRVPVTSIKGVTGNPLAAAGPFQLISCALAIKHNAIPPTANHEIPRLGCDLDFVTKRARKAQLTAIMINVRGLGAGNSTMIVERIDE